MAKINIVGTKDFMAQWAPKLAALLQGDWVVINDTKKIKIPDSDNVTVNIAAANGKSRISFDQPLAFETEENWGPFSKDFRGTVDGVIEISDSGAQLKMSGMPLGNNVQYLQWVP